jgi:dTDP-4-amino-4,6-dideoxygalactose transaminase
VIPLASPIAQYRAHKSTIKQAIARVLESGTYILGHEVESFEHAFAAYCNASHAIGVANGTDALALALKAIGIGPGDEVITVSHSALATIAAVLAAGATPVLVDIHPESLTIDPSQLESAIGPKTKGIVAVHLYGLPVDLDGVLAVARRNGLKIIEDCAQAVGATYKGRRVGGIADVGCFSFYPTKNLGAIGDGGMIVTNDHMLASRVRRLRQYGWDELRRTDEIGVNSRLDSLQAAILTAKLEHLDQDNARRRKLADRYRSGLANLPIVVPVSGADRKHVYHLYVVMNDDRDGLAKHLAARNIGTAVHYAVPAHRHGGYSARVRLPAGGLPVTERTVGRILSLPMYPELSDDEVDRVVAGVREFYRA